MMRRMGFRMRVRVVGCALVLGLLGMGRVVRGQVASSSTNAINESQNEPIHTLRVYMDLLQIPVLVLDYNRQPMRPVEAERFFVSLDSGPKFHPTHIRAEGDDPITLSIVFDLTGPEAELTPKLNEAIAGLANGSLRASDHVSIYALDCTLTRSLEDVVADPERLKAGVDAVIQPWIVRQKEKPRAPCERKTTLWDTLAHVVRTQAFLPGRRVILAVSSGNSRVGNTKPEDVKRFAQQQGVAIFGLSTPWNRVSVQHPDQEGAFNLVCQTSGGMVMTTHQDELGKSLSRFVAMLRERYILEFPRARNGTAGEHDISVTIAHSDAFIRPAGIAVPIRDPELAKDPNTVITGPANAPEMGTRRPVPRPR